MEVGGLKKVPNLFFWLSQTAKWMKNAEIHLTLHHLGDFSRPAERLLSTCYFSSLLSQMSLQR